MRTSLLSLSLISLVAATAAPLPLHAPVRGSEAGSKGVLLDFTADWCGPCQQMKPLVHRLKRQGAPIRQVNVDREPKLARRFRIRSIPAFVLVVGGREVDRVVGLCSEARLKGLLAKIPREQPTENSPASPRSNPPSARSLPSATVVAQTEQPTSHGRREKETAGQTDNRTIEERDGSPSTLNPVIRANIGREDSSFPAPAADDPVACSTRIRVKDEQGINYGSGTIIDSRPGRTIVLTCGHIFRNVDRESMIEVDVFDGDQFERYVGTVLRYDLDADVGLLSIPTDTRLPVAEVAGPDERVSRGARVFSVGCGGGELPSEQPLRVTALNRYLGPDNIECTGVPVQGRSGGGLFNTEGEVVGVCIAADPKEQRGLYAGLKAVQRLLDRAELAQLYREQPHREQPSAPKTPSPSAPEIVDTVSASPSLLGSEGDVPWRNQPSIAANGQFPDPLTQDDVLPALADTSAEFDATDHPQGTRDERDLRSPEGDPSLPASDRTSVEVEQAPARPRSDAPQLATLQTALEQAHEAEVICIVRPLDDPQAASRVVIINRASAKFLAYLTGEVRDQPQMTTVVKRSENRQAERRRFDGGMTAPRAGQVTTEQLRDDEDVPRRQEARPRDSHETDLFGTSSASETVPVSMPRRYRRSVSVR